MVPGYFDIHVHVHNHLLNPLCILIQISLLARYPGLLQLNRISDYHDGNPDVQTHLLAILLSLTYTPYLIRPA
jgi:hypothetical protein